MGSLLFFCGAGLVFYGVFLAARNMFTTLSRERVMGTVITVEEVTDFGLSDSTHRAVVRYADPRGVTRKAYTKPRAMIGGYAPGKNVPVYLSKKLNASPLVGGFQEMWLFPLCSLGLGALCLALAYV